MRYAGGALAIVALATAGGGASAASGGPLERSVRAASLVVIAEDGQLARPAPRPVLWKFQVVEMLKGDAGPVEILVDLEKAPVGLWPRKGERTILCLEWGKENAYHLARHFQSILAPDDAGAVRRAVEADEAARVVKAPPTPVERRETPTVSAPVGRPKDPAAELMRRRIADSETILVGRLSDVHAAAQGRTEGVFRVEESLLGYGGFAEPITVRFQGQPPEAGRYALFLKGSLSDDSFAAPSREGVVRVAGDAAEKRLKDSVRAALGDKGKVLTTVQAALAEWQAAWNSRSLERCMKCYSRESSLRKRYESGEEDREKLRKQMQEFPGKVALSLRQISLTARPGSKAADATVVLKLTAPGLEDRRTAVMQFVHEDGEWLILNEGF